MEYTNKEMKRFVNRIKLTEEKKQSYANQIDTLKGKVSAAIGRIEGIKLLKVKRSGSWKKGTALAPRNEKSLDIDMVFFIEKEEGYTFDAEAIRNDLIGILCTAYPNKKPEDFSNGKKTVGVVFRGTGLEVDIVPFILQNKNSKYGLQPEKILDSGTLMTSVDGQLQFCRNLRRKNTEYSSIVRMLKHWRNEKELDLPSFAIEVLTGQAIQDGEISGTAIDNGAARVWEWLGREEALKVCFGKRGKAGSERPWISDPTNDSNNIVAKVLNSWDEVMQEAERAWETIMYAKSVEGKRNTHDLWKEVMGPRFNIDEE